MTGAVDLVGRVEPLNAIEPKRFEDAVAGGRTADRLAQQHRAIDKLAERAEYLLRRYILRRTHRFGRIHGE